MEIKVRKNYKTSIREIKKILGLDKYCLLHDTNKKEKSNKEAEEFLKKYGWMIS